MVASHLRGHHTCESVGGSAQGHHRLRSGSRLSPHPGARPALSALLGARARGTECHSQIKSLTRPGLFLGGEAHPLLVSELRHRWACSGRLHALGATPDPVRGEGPRESSPGLTRSPPWLCCCLAGRDPARALGSADRPACPPPGLQEPGLSLWRVRPTVCLGPRQGPPSAAPGGQDACQPAPPRAAPQTPHGGRAHQRQERPVPAQQAAAPHWPGLPRCHPGFTRETHALPGSCLE